MSKKGIALGVVALASLGACAYLAHRHSNDRQIIHDLKARVAELEGQRAGTRNLARVTSKPDMATPLPMQEASPAAPQKAGPTPRRSTN